MTGNPHFTPFTLPLPTNTGLSHLVSMGRGAKATQVLMHHTTFYENRLLLSPKTTLKYTTIPAGAHHLILFEDRSVLIAFALGVETVVYPAVFALGTTLDASFPTPLVHWIQQTGWRTPLMHPIDKTKALQKLRAHTGFVPQWGTLSLYPLTHLKQLEQFLWGITALFLTPYEENPTLTLLGSGVNAGTLLGPSMLCPRATPATIKQTIKHLTALWLTQEHGAEYPLICLNQHSLLTQNMLQTATLNEPPGSAHDRANMLGWITTATPHIAQHATTG